MSNKRITHLWNGVNTLSSKNHTENILKSYYLTICRELAASDSSLPESHFGERAMCSKCSSCWYDGNFVMKIMSQQLKGSKGRKLIEAYKSGGNDLTRKQKLRAKWYLKKSSSYVEILCKICEHKTKILLQKPKKSKLKKEVVEQDIQSAQVVGKQKKKKKKDKFAGLKITTTNAKISSPHQQQQIINKEKQKSSNASEIKQNSKKLKKLQPSSTMNIKKAITKIIKPSSTKNSKGKQQQQQKQQRSTQSNTQKKNTLLQLAQILKKSGSTTNQSTSNTNDRLKNLLR